MRHGYDESALNGALVTVEGDVVVQACDGEFARVAAPLVAIPSDQITAACSGSRLGWGHLWWRVRLSCHLVCLRLTTWGLARGCRRGRSRRMSSPVAWHHSRQMAWSLSGGKAVCRAMERREMRRAAANGSRSGSRPGWSTASIIRVRIA